MSHLSSGEMLASSESVAMTPTIQPAAAGTQRSGSSTVLALRAAVVAL